MEMSSLVFGFLLVSTALSTCDGSVMSEGLPTWQDIRSKLLVRREREVLPEMMTNTTYYEMSEEELACSYVMDCQYYGGKLATFYQIMGSFRMAEIADHLDEWCGVQPGSCWDDRCDELDMKKRIESTDRVVQWMCNNKEGFEDKTCFTATFRNKMRSCETHYSGVYMDSSKREQVLTLMRFRRCGLKALDDLPGCSRNSFFADYFRFVVNEQVRHIQD